MKVSIITASLNGGRTIRECLKSIAEQDYQDIEHLIIDGGSTDGTVEILKGQEMPNIHWISEPDLGLYDAMNKGIRAATGEIIGILNADDVYADGQVIDRVVAGFQETGADTCYGDLVYFKGDDSERPVRCWTSGPYSRHKFRMGWMPPHPTFFVRRDIYIKYGLFNLAFPLAADYELMLRFLYRFHVSATYLPRVLVKMRTGGKCRPGWTNTLHNIRENRQAWQVNHLQSNPLTFLLKPLRKTLQYLTALS